MTRIRNLFPALALAAFMTGSLQAHAADKFQPLDSIAAIVNNAVITQRQLEAETARVAGRFDPSNMSPSDRKRLEGQVLDRMITHKVELERAAQQGITIDDTRLNQALSGIASRNGMTLPQLQQAITNSGRNWADYRKNIREQMLIEELKRRDVYERINISDREINDYIKRYTGGSTEKNEYHLQQILISVPENATPSEVDKARKRAEDALAALKSGQSFDQVSAERSDAPNAEKGGDLGWRDTSTIPSLFIKPLKSLKKGQFSDLIRSPNGYHIIKLDGTRKVGKGAKIEEYRVEHVLIRPSADLPPQAAHDQAVRLRQQIIDGKTSFAQVAREFSDDKGSAAKGGMLGWVRPDSVVPAFADMIRKTSVGQISPVFRSQYGFHFLKVLDKRNVTLSADELRSKARQAIGKRRADEELVNWVRRLRAEAYIDNRLTGTINGQPADQASTSAK